MAARQPQDDEFALEKIEGVTPANQTRSRKAQARLLKAGEQVLARKG